MDNRRRVVVTPGYAIENTLASFPAVCFTLALVTDIIYWRTSYLMWSHFSSWLLFFGLVVSIAAVIAAVIGFVTRSEYRERLFWPYVGTGALVLVLALVNSFVHSSDGWTSVVPTGLILSALTVIIMIAAGWLGYARRSPEARYG